MAIGFDETDDFYNVPDAAELTLQDGDWCIGVWTYVSDNTGTQSQYVISNGTWGATPSFNLALYEDTYGTVGLRGHWATRVVDDDGTTPGSLESASAPGGDSTWRLIVVQRSTTDNEIQLWFCEKDAAPVKEDSGSDAGFDAMNGSNWNIGRRTDGDADRYYGSIAAEVWKGDFALSSTEIQALGAGLPIKTLAKKAGYTLDLYLPMWEADATLLDYSNSGNDATRNSAPTTETHAPVCTPTKRHRIGG